MSCRISLSASSCWSSASLAALSVSALSSAISVSSASVSSAASFAEPEALFLQLTPLVEGCRVLACLKFDCRGTSAVLAPLRWHERWSLNTSRGLHSWLHPCWCCGPRPVAKSSTWLSFVCHASPVSCNTTPLSLLWTVVFVSYDPCRRPFVRLLLAVSTSVRAVRRDVSCSATCVASSNCIDTMLFGNCRIRLIDLHLRNV